MKTNLETQKENRIQMATFKSVALVASLFIISIAANAQGADHSSHGTNGDEPALLADNTVNTNKKSNSVFNSNAAAFMAAYLEAESEEVLELEDWMTNDSQFGMFITIEQEAEELLELEVWMTDENKFFNASLDLTEEEEEKLDLEDWMFNGNTFLVVPDPEEKPLTVEDWMLAENTWNR